MSIIWGSPMADNMRSAALAYLRSPRQDSKYSAIGMSVSRRASKERAKRVGTEKALYISPRATVGPIAGARTLLTAIEICASLIANQQPLCQLNFAGSPRQYAKVSICQKIVPKGFPVARMLFNLRRT